jgi:hypothetical protein
MRKGWRLRAIARESIGLNSDPQASRHSGSPTDSLAASWRAEDFLAIEKTVEKAK